MNVCIIYLIRDVAFGLVYLTFYDAGGQGRGNIFDSLTPSEVPEGSSGDDVRASHSTSYAGGESSFLQLRFE